MVYHHTFQKRLQHSILLILSLIFLMTSIPDAVQAQERSWRTWFACPVELEFEEPENTTFIGNLVQQYSVPLPLDQLLGLPSEAMDNTLKQFQRIRARGKNKSVDGDTQCIIAACCCLLLTFGAASS